MVNDQSTPRERQRRIQVFHSRYKSSGTASLSGVPWGQQEVAVSATRGGKCLQPAQKSFWLQHRESR